MFLYATGFNTKYGATPCTMAYLTKMFRECELCSYLHLCVHFLFGALIFFFLVRLGLVLRKERVTSDDGGISIAICHLHLVQQPQRKWPLYYQIRTGPQGVVLCVETKFCNSCFLHAKIHHEQVSISDRIICQFFYRHLEIIMTSANQQ